MSFWIAVKKVLREANVILLVADARMPVLSMNSEVKQKVEIYGKKTFIIFNKTDLISKKELETLRKENPTAFFISATLSKGLDSLRDRLEHEAELYSPELMKVGIVGYPNVGKSSLINRLTGRGSASVSSTAGTTKGVQWIKSGNLKFMDSPGVIPFDDKSAKLGMLGAKNPEKLKNPQILAREILQNFLNKDKKILERHYKIECHEDIEEIFFAIGKKRGFLGKGGIVDETKTAIHIIRDWQRGNIKG